MYVSGNLIVRLHVCTFESFNISSFFPSDPPKIVFFLSPLRSSILRS